ncbi:MAG: polysaccharide deacetylase [Lachnospiraceae bacterium]|nr:polysaccharide deacetylase [Lachnospiraceae bacterium]
MGANSQEELAKQMNRRRRVKRIKSTIIWIFSSWLILSMTICGVLIVQSFRMNHQLDTVTNQLNSVTSRLNQLSQNGESDGTDKDISSTIDEYMDEVISYQGNVENSYQTGDVRQVYFTFDDGPSEQTEEILDVLKKNNVKATFFVVGKTDERSKELYRRIVDEGHTIGLHSYSHKYSDIYASKAAFQADLQKISDLIYQITGQRTMLYRFPGGSSNKVSNVDMQLLIQYLNESGYTYFDWNVMSGDASTQNFSAEILTQNVMSGIKKSQTSIVLYHDADTRTATVQSLTDVINQLIDMGAQILPIDDNTKKIQHIRAIKK